jgi:hypothetical protein
MQQQETVMPGDRSPLEDNSPDGGIPQHPSLMRWMDVAKTRVRFPDAASLEAADSGDRPAADQAKLAASFRKWHGRPNDAFGPI